MPEQFKVGNPVKVIKYIDRFGIWGSEKYEGREGKVKDCCFGMVEVKFPEKDEQVFTPEELELIK